MNEDFRKAQLLDRFIRELLIDGITYIYDPTYRHKTNSEFDKANKVLIELFTDRLEREHPKAKYVSHCGIFDGIDYTKVETHNL